MLIQLLTAVTVPIINVEDSQHLVEISLGTPPQRVEMLLDTGSNTVWVPSTYCVSVGCKHHTKFNHSASATFRAEEVEFEVDYRSGIIVGELAYDSVHVGSLTLQELPLGLVFKEIGDAFGALPFSGILGLGFGTPDYPSLFDRIVTSGKLKENLAGIYLSPSPDQRGELTFGEVKVNRVDGPVVYANLIGSTFWDIEIDEFLIDDRATSLCDSLRSRRGKCVAAIDTGTVLLAGPSSFISELKTRIPVSPSCDGTESLPTIGILIDGVSLELSPEDYVIYEGGRCKLAAMEMDVGPPRGPLFVIGTTFLRRYYTVLDRDGKRVGFAKLK